MARQSMIIGCESCGTTYNIADEKVRGRRVRVRCKTCGSAIVVDGQQLPPEDQTRPMRLEDTTRRYNQSFEDDDESTKVMTAPPTFGRPMVSGARSAPPPPLPNDEEWTVNFSDADSRTLSLAAIMDAYSSGTLPEDAFAWRPGMDDWMPVFEVPEIREALATAVPTKVASYAAMTGGAAAAVHTGAIQPVASFEPPKSRTGGGRAAVRAASKREPRPDLFSRANAAGSEAELLASTSEPPAAAHDPKLTGARNESSVLFSLDAVKGGRAAASAPPKAAVAMPKTAADILGIGSANAPAFNMTTNAALLTAPAVEPEPEPPPPSVHRARMDTTPPIARRGRSGFVWMLVGAIGTTVVLGGAGVAFMLSRGMPLPFPVPARVAPYVPVLAHYLGAPPPEPSPTTAAQTPPPAASATAPSSTATATASAVETIPVASTAPPSTPATASPGAVTKIPPAPSPAPRGASGKTSSAAGTSTAPASSAGIPKVVLEEEQSSASGKAATGPAFDTAAAKAALEGAAAAAAGCKQPDGPTGKGKVQVTFAPSGRATSASITAGDFGGTPVGGCVVRAFRAAAVPAFSGDPVTVSKSFTIAP